MTLLPALVGVAALRLVFTRPRLGSAPLGGYSVFWFVIFSKVLPSIWNAKRSFCFEGLGLCITTPWISRLMVLGLATGFLMVAVWSWRKATAN